MPLDQSAPASVSTDSVMAQLLDEFTDQLNAGQQPDVDAWLAKHPEMAATLRPVLDALHCVYDMSQSGQSPLDSSYGGETNGKERRLGDFRILREIGRGGMGIVFEAEQLSMGRTVALKVLPFASVLDEKAITRFKNEARAAGTLHHPNIVPVHSVGNERGVYYYAMALIEGLTVAEIIRELHDQVLSGNEPGSIKCRLDDVVAGRANAVQRFVERHTSPDDATIDDEGNSKAAKLNACDAQTAREVRAAISTRRSSFDRSFFQQVARIGIQAGEALQHAHEHGIVHRDIKPGNLMIDTTGKLWVTDFGLARIATDPGLTMTGDLVGTLRYMAPEQALANRMVVDHRADIYSLGVTLYELTTLRPAFDAASRQGLLKQLTFDEPAPPRQINPSLPTDLATIVCQAMSKRPDDRYSSARCMVDDLRAFLEERPIAAKPPTLLQRAGKWSSRNRPLVVLAVILLVLSTIGLAISNLLIGQERNQKVMALADTTRALAGEQQAHRAEQTARAEIEQSKQRAEASAAEAYRQQYRAEMQLGLVDLEAGNLSRLYQTLVSHLPEPNRADRRDWEWYHLLSRCQEGRTLCQHYGFVSSLAWSPDGRYLATTSYDGDAIVWDARTGQRVRRFSFGATLKRGVAWSPDSQQLAWGSAADENAVRIWDLRTDQVRILYGHAHSLVSCAWSPDGSRLATTSMDETVRIWDPETGSCLRVLGGRYRNVNAACWVDDGKLLVGASSEGMQVWDVESGEVRHECSGQFKSATTTSTNPQRLLLGGVGGELRLIDIQSWQVSHEMAAHAGQVSTVAFSPDGAMFASSGTDRTVIVWDAAEARQRFVLRGHQGEVTSLAWNPTGKQIAAGCADGTVKLWDLPPSPHPVTFQGPEEKIVSLIWSKDDRLVTALSLTGSMPSDSHRDTRTIWDRSTGNQMESRSTDPGTRESISPDGRLRASVVVVGAGDVSMLVENVVDNEVVHQFPFRIRNNFSMVWSADSKRLVAYDYKNLSIWEIASEQRIFAWEGPAIQAVSWAPDNVRLAVAGGGDLTDNGGPAHLSHVHVFDVERKIRVLKVLLGSQRVLATAVAWHPNGEMLAAGNGNGLTGVWEVATGRQVATAQPHVAAVNALDWTGNGSRIASVSVDGSLKIWDPLTGDELLLLASDKKPLTAVKWSSDSTQLAVGDDQGKIQIWCASTRSGSGSRAVEQRTLAHMHASRAAQRGIMQDLPGGLVELTRAIELAPSRPSYRRSRAILYAQQQKWDESLADLAAAIDLDPDDSVVLSTSVDVDAALGRWSETLPGASRLVELNQSAPERHRLAVIHLLLGQTEAYREICQQQLAGDPAYLFLAIWTCTVVPKAVPDYERIVSLAREYVSTLNASTAGSLTSLGALLYRAGQFEEATQRLIEASRIWEQSGSMSSTSLSPYDLLPGYAWYYLAMACHDLGRFEESRAWFAKAEGYTQSVLAEPTVFYQAGAIHWHQRTVLEWLQREARTQLGLTAAYK